MQSLFDGHTANPIYRAEPDLRVLDHDGKKIVVNPELGAWAVVSLRELIELVNPFKNLSREVGEAAHRNGLARKNGNSVFDSQVQEDKIFFFEFIVSDSCNLACTYCCAATVPVKQIPRVDPAAGRLWIDRCLEYAKANGVRKIELEFTGGEPLANVDFLDATCEYGLRRAAEEGVEASLSLVTNLTLVGVRQLEFLQKYPIQINASLDGDEEDHNSQRPFAAGRGSYRAVLKNVGKLRDVGLKLHAIQTTVTTRTVDKLPQIAERLLELGFTQLSLHRMNMGGIANPAAAALIPEPERYVDKLFETFETQYLPFWRRHGIMPHARHLGLAYAYLLEPKRAYMCQRSPCGAGRTIIAVKPNGDVHGCAIAPWDGIFHYGNINRQSFEECRQSPGASASAERSSSKIPGCSTCLYRGWCQSGCPRDAFAKHGTIMAPSSSCKFYKELWQRSLFSLVDERYPETAIRALARSYLS